MTAAARDCGRGPCKQNAAARDDLACASAQSASMLTGLISCSMASRMQKILGVSFSIVMLAPAGAQADGDPASDVLLTRDLFFTYNPPPSPARERTLNAQIAAARAAHLPLKVALIRDPHDLGLVPE